MPPEAVSDGDNQPDARADIYSLGVVFYELLTGRLPLDADSTGELRNLILFQEPPLPRTIRPEIPEELQSICLKCLAKAPMDRYLTAGDLAQSLRSWLAKRPLPQRKFLVAVILLAIVLAAVGGWLFLVKQRPKAEAPARQEPTSPAHTSVPFRGNANSVQFHLMQREIYVMDTSATRIFYSLDGRTWKEAESFRIEGGAMQWAAALVSSGDMQALAVSDKPRLFVKYTNHEGLESEPVEFTPKASDFEAPFKPPTFNLPKIPKIKLPSMPGLPEKQKEELERIQERLEKELPGNRKSE